MFQYCESWAAAGAASGRQHHQGGDERAVRTVAAHGSSRGVTSGVGGVYQSGACGSCVFHPPST